MTSTWPTERRAADWIAKRDGGTWDAAAQRELDRWLDESPANRVAYLRLHSAWERADRLRALRGADRSVQSDVIAERAKSSRGAQPWTRVYLMAAAITFAGIGLVISGDLTRPGDEQKLSTPVGARETVALADGSKVTLNTATQLRTVINDQERSVWLDGGEAYFDVVHDATRPFVLIVGNRRVVVVGTRFTLRRDADLLRIDVLEGRVQLQIKGEPPTVISRDESAVSAGRNVLITRRTAAQSAAATGWLEGRLIFDQSTMTDVAEQFNRYNMKKLVITDPAAGSIRIGGMFDATNVEGFARLIQSGFGLAVDVRDGKIFVSNGLPEGSNSQDPGGRR